MSTDPHAAPRPLPDRPNLRHLKDQARDLVKAGTAKSITDAQFTVARLYGFLSWPKLKAHVELLEQLRRAAEINDVVRIRSLLNEQATALITSGTAASTVDAQLQMARLFGLTSWAGVEAQLALIQQRSDVAFPSEEVRQLKHAIDANDIEGVKTLMARNPELHRAPLGYGKDGPLTWVAECRVPWAPPSPTRLAMARWMIDHGSDVHQGGDGPLMRAALKGNRIPMMELLVSYGADVNAEWHGEFPIVFAPCEAVDPEALKWLLDHGANPNCADPNRRFPDTALDYVIGTYVRSPERLRACIDLLLRAGGVTKGTEPAVIDLLGGRLHSLDQHLVADMSLLTRQLPALDFGPSGGRLLTLSGATLLHVAAEYHELEAARLLLDRGANVNARAAVDDAGVGGQTAIFHAVTQSGDEGLPMTQFLVDRGADLSVRVKLPGDYERPGEVVECTPLGYARRFQKEFHAESRTIAFLRERGAVE
jgi:ankyrin repeat protein